MKHSFLSVTLFVILVLVAVAPAGAQSPPPCTCFDMFDLINRQKEEEAAIDQYTADLASWSTPRAIPSANDAERHALQARVKAAMNAVTQSRANKTNAETDALCETIIDAPTACLQEVVRQHEFVHRNACQQHRNGNIIEALLSRWDNLAAYAKEEIDAYSTELAYVRGSLANLERECRFTMEFRSTIDGKAEMVTSTASAAVDLAMSLPKELAPKGLTGSAKLKYDTRDPGPPTTVIGPPDLAKKVPRCYVTFEGKGEIALDVMDGWLMRDTTPPYVPLIDLTLSVGTTSEQFMLKGGKFCRPRTVPATFWSARFVMGKTLLGDPSLHRIVIDDWAIAPRTGVFAERIFAGTCRPPGAGVPAGVVGPPTDVFALGPTTPGVGTSLTLYPANVVPAMLAAGVCVEKTTLTLKLKPK